MRESTKELSGRELDKAIATALGFKPSIVWAVLTEDETALMIDFEREAEARKWWDEHPSVHEKHHLGTLEIYEPYSESTEAAMRVVEKMRRDHFRFACNDRCDPKSGEWWAEFATLEYERGGQASAGTLPEAVCRAALTAIESKPA
jgi:hypothetical protein